MVFNARIAAKLRDMADVLEQQEASAFRVSAYRRAAATLDTLGEGVDIIFAREGREGLKALPGVGARQVALHGALLKHSRSACAQQDQRLGRHFLPDGRRARGAMHGRDRKRRELAEKSALCAVVNENARPSTPPSHSAGERAVRSAITRVWRRRVRSGSAGERRDRRASARRKADRDRAR